MGAQTYSGTDFNAWDLTNLEVADGKLQPAEGYRYGTAVSPAYMCAPFQDEYGRVTATGSVGQGCAIRFRARVAATEEGLATADWSPWMDTWGVAATEAVADLGMEQANAGIDATDCMWIQWGVYISRE